MLTPPFNTEQLRSFIKPDEQGVVHIAAFDFDGTSIRGNSPVVLVQHLALAERMLSKTVVLKIIAWAIAYKTHLPQNESWVRQQVFSGFAGKPVKEVDAYLADFFHKKIAQRIRPMARETMLRHVEAGHAVVCVSASFEPMLLEATKELPFQFQISTRMKVDENGNYTNQVDGLPIEGDEKLAALTRLADKEFGEGKWVLDWAYADHYSDETILSAATHPYAVTPSGSLTRIAREKGWEILHWPDV